MKVTRIIWKFDGTFYSPTGIRIARNENGILTSDAIRHRREASPAGSSERSYTCVINVNRISAFARHRNSAYKRDAAKRA